MTDEPEVTVWAAKCGAIEGPGYDIAPRRLVCRVTDLSDPFGAGRHPVAGLGALAAGDLCTLDDSRGFVDGVEVDGLHPDDCIENGRTVYRLRSAPFAHEGGHAADLEVVLWQSNDGRTWLSVDATPGGFGAVVALVRP